MGIDRDVSLLQAEFVDRGLFVNVAGAEDGIGLFPPIGMMDGIRELLGFQAEGGVLFVDCSTFTLERAVEEVAGIELEAGFGGVHFKGTSAGGFDNAGGKFGAFGRPFIQHEVEVVAAGTAPEAGEVLADRFGLGEIEGGVTDRGDFARGDEGIVGGSVMGGGEGGDVIEDGTTVMPGEVEVAMVSQIAEGGGVGGSPVVDDQLIVVGEGVADGDREAARVAFLAGGAGVTELDTGTDIVDERFRPPEFFVEAGRTTVQMMRTVVGGQLVFFAVEGENASGDAIGTPAHIGPEVGMASQIILELVETQDNVGELTLLVGDVDFGDDATVVDAADHDIVGVDQSIASDRLVFPLGRGSGERAPGFLFISRPQTGWRSCRLGRLGPAAAGQHPQDDGCTDCGNKPTPGHGIFLLVRATTDDNERDQPTTVGTMVSPEVHFGETIPQYRGKSTSAPQGSAIVRIQSDKILLRKLQDGQTADTLSGERAGGESVGHFLEESPPGKRVRQSLLVRRRRNGLGAGGRSGFPGT